MRAVVLGEALLTGEVAVARREVDGTLRRAETGQDLFLKRLTDECQVLISTLPELTLQAINARLHVLTEGEVRWAPVYTVDLTSMATGFLAARRRFNGSDVAEEVFGPPSYAEEVSRALGLDPQPFEIDQVVNKRLSWAIQLYDRVSR